MGQYLDANAPIGGDGNWPLPNVVQTSGPGQPSLTYEGPVINGIPMPGQWLITDLKKVFNWQEQQASFQSGAVLVPRGDPLVRVTYEVRIWESGTMGVFRGLLATLLKKPAAAVPGGVVPVSAALGIHDAALKDLGVTAVVVSEIDYPKNPLVASGGRGPWIGKVSFIQYRPPVPALPVPDQSIPDPGAVTPAASTNLATAATAVAAGDAARQSAAATALVPAR